MNPIERHRRGLSALVLAVMLSACTSVNPYYDPDDATRPHHRPEGFVNSDSRDLPRHVPWYEALWRRWRGDFEPASPPAGGYPAFIEKWTTPIDRAQLRAADPDPRITWLGHSSLLLQVAGRNILIDPQFSDYAGPLRLLSAPRRVPAPLAAEHLPPIDLVLISHNHYDHLDEASITALVAAGQRPRFLVPLGLKAWFDGRGIARVSEMDWWDSVDEGPLRIHFTPARHWSKRTLLDTNQSLWGGFFVESNVAGSNVASNVNGPRWRFLYTGDTGYSNDFRAIRNRLGAVDLLAVPVGAYQPRDFMAPQHIDPDEAVQILLDVEAANAIGVHWGTFELSQEPFDRPPSDVRTALDKRRLDAQRLLMLRHGETRRFAAPTAGRRHPPM
jgi:L-ascorbate metabolism protein UlaG (beta-lactamase superfamily)